MLNVKRLSLILSLMGLFLSLSAQDDTKKKQSSYEPAVKLSEALDITRKYIKDNKVNISSYYLESAKLVSDPNRGKGKQWLLTWKLKTVSHGGEIYIYVDMSKKVKLYRGL